MIEKKQWLPNLSDLNLWDYCVWGTVLEVLQKFHGKRKTVLS